MFPSRPSTRKRRERYEKNKNSYQSPCFSFTSEIAASTFPTLEGKNKYSLGRTKNSTKKQREYFFSEQSLITVANHQLATLIMEIQRVPLVQRVLWLQHLLVVPGIPNIHSTQIQKKKKIRKRPPFTLVRCETPLPW